MLVLAIVSLGAKQPGRRKLKEKVPTEEGGKIKERRGFQVRLECVRPWVRRWVVSP